MKPINEKWLKLHTRNFRDLFNVINYNWISEVYLDGKLTGSHSVWLETPKNKRLRMKEIRRDGDVFTLCSIRFKFDFYYLNDRIERYAKVRLIKIDFSEWEYKWKLWLWR